MSRDASPAPARRHPHWIRARAPTGVVVHETKGVVRGLGLHTVCEEARCPNIGECWAHRTATFMLMGDVCTRNCGFCAVAHGRPADLDPGEPQRIARGVAQLGLGHVVVTSVDRDDLPDGGAQHFAATARAIKEAVRGCRVEVLVPDFSGREASIDVVLDSPIDILNHNVETVPRLYRQARPGAKYERSLGVLRRAHEQRPSLVTKTGVMVGLGERQEELLAVFADLRAVGCQILTLGQYLQPSRHQLPVQRYVSPEEFSELREEALDFGFRHVEAGPLVRSSYRAWEQVG